MPRREADDQFDDEFADEDDVAAADDDDRDAPLASDVDAAEDDEIGDPCPYCGKAVYEGAEMCSHCGSFISVEDAPLRLPWWIWAGAVLALLGALWWAL